MKSTPPATELMRKAFEAIAANAAVAAIAARDVDGLVPLWDEHTVDVFIAIGVEVVGPADCGPSSSRCSWPCQTSTS